MMPTYETEREAWQALLDVLEGYGMPPYQHGLPTAGLCAAIDQMWIEGAIDSDTLEDMRTRIESNADLCELWKTHPRDAAPRIPYVRKFLEDLS